MARSASSRIRPQGQDAACGVTASALYVWGVLAGFPPNGVREHLQLVAAYFMLYALAFAAAAWALRVGLSSVRKRELDRFEAHLPRLIVLLAAAALAALGREAPLAPIAFTAIAVIGLGSVSRASWARMLGTAFACGLLAHGVLAEALPESERASVQTPSARRARHPVRMLGLDGIDLRVLERLLAQSRPLPNFRRLLAGGVSAPMQTVSSHSPLIWTSLVTGVRPEVHGVTDYVTPYLKGTSVSLPDIRGDVLGRVLTRKLGLREIGAVTSRQRRTPAIWEILSDFGHSALVLNWWASYPADPVRGTLISNQAIPWSELSTPEIARIRSRTGLVHPPELQTEVLDEISRLVAAPRYRGVRFNFEISPFAGGTSAPPEHAPAAPMERAHSLALDAQQHYFASRDEVAFALHEKLANPAFDLEALYLQGVDIASHVYTAEAFGGDGENPLPLRLSEQRARELWETLVVQAYVTMDARIGRWLDALEPHEVLIVVSDHGWNYDGTAHNGAPDGAFFAYGEPFNVGLRLPRVHVLDMLPTLGRLLEVPVSKALPGRVLDAAFAPAVRDRAPAQAVETYRPRAPARAGVTRDGDPGYAARLRALGYVQ